MECPTGRRARSSTGRAAAGHPPAPGRRGPAARRHAGRGTASPGSAPRSPPAARSVPEGSASDARRSPASPRAVGTGHHAHGCNPRKLAEDCKAHTSGSLDPGRPSHYPATSCPLCPTPESMRVDLFDFDLPPALIAQAPVRPRDAAGCFWSMAARGGKLWCANCPACCAPATSWCSTTRGCCRPASSAVAARWRSR